MRASICTVLALLSIAQATPYLKVFFKDEYQPKFQDSKPVSNEKSFVSHHDQSDGSADNQPKTTKKPSVPHLENPCKRIWCKPGRTCRVNTVGKGECACMTSQQCKVWHPSPQVACGVDGILYPSHCELHRSACTTRKHIKQDRTGKSCVKKGKGKVQMKGKKKHIMILPKPVEGTSESKQKSEVFHHSNSLKDKKPHGLKKKHDTKNPHDKSHQSHHRGNKKELSKNSEHFEKNKLQGKKTQKDRKILKDDLKKDTETIHEDQHEGLGKSTKKKQDGRVNKIKLSKLNENERHHVGKKELRAAKGTPKKEKGKKNVAKHDDSFHEYFQAVVKEFYSKDKLTNFSALSYEEEQSKNDTQPKKDVEKTVTEMSEDKAVDNSKGSRKSSSSTRVPVNLAETKVPTTVKTKTTTQDKLEIKECTSKDFMKFKKNLLIYHCKRINIECDNKPFLGNVMFTYYDQDLDGYLVQSELDYIHKRDHLDKVSGGKCQLSDLLFFDDKIFPLEKINKEEFFNAFRIPQVHLDKKLKFSRYVATQGSQNAVEMQCNIKGTTKIIWNRNGHDISNLENQDIKILDDNSLFISNIGLEHTGNYTCQQKEENYVVQTHILKVQVAPKVTVSPSSKYYSTGSEVIVKCHASGLPPPDIRWQINEVDLPIGTKQQHYVYYRKNRMLRIKSSNFKQDTGAYKCIGSNYGGQDEAISTVFIGPDKVSNYKGSLEVFAVFHSDGYHVYEPETCTMRHTSTGKFSLAIGGKASRLCEANKPCLWGSVVNVKNKFLYVSQPTLDRLVVINLQTYMNPVEYITTDEYPTKLHYVKALDEIWVSCGKNNQSRTVQVIRRVSENTPHLTVHTQPIGDHFDKVSDYFLPPEMDMESSKKYGYITHGGESSIKKIEIDTLRYVSTIDLSRYKCLPKKISFIPIGGLVIVSCADYKRRGSPAHVMVDYVTDSVLQTLETPGDVYVSPDSLDIVFMDHDSADAEIYKMQENGTLQKTFHLVLPVKISRLTFFPGGTGVGYDLYAGTPSGSDVLFVELDTGKIRLLPGINGLTAGVTSRHLAMRSGGMFTDYVITSTDESVVLIDGRAHRSECELPHIKNGDVISWFDV